MLAAALMPGLAAADELPSYQVTLRAGHIEPAVLEVSAQSKFKLVIRNDGPGPCEFESLDLRIEKVLAAGASSFVVIHPLRAGRYRFIDEFHADTGRMDLVVR